MITHQNSEVLKTYGIVQNSKEYHTGIDILGKDIFCPCNGVCIYVGLVDSQLSCTIQYSQNICLRFSNMAYLDINQGDVVSYDQKIGQADKYIHFEYLTSERTYPYFRVFFNSTQSYYMYKHDPMLVLSGNVVFDNTTKLQSPVTPLIALYEDGLDPHENR